ncbi:TonB-dependent receptor [Gloeocapsa sp. PCC 7428]|uniref:TonB-dependent receptor n=1 Tax=Gloeocapsa sp. PCC 7428 TaxID=1173026 RepID=UPI0002A6113E|nr:TonB-dependent receptor [Gloeocapsa sp. PCC 7428]AFZ32589.1 TonB-dependent receptor [Gloeocapsa sp. PCC 7428]
MLLVATPVAALVTATALPVAMHMAQANQAAPTTQAQPQNNFTAITEIGVTAPMSGRAVLAAEGFDYSLRQYFAGTAKNLDYRFDISTRFNNSIFDAQGNLLPNSSFGSDDSTQLDAFGSANIYLSKTERLQFAFRTVQQFDRVNVVPDEDLLQTPGRQQAWGIRRRVTVRNTDPPGTASTDLSIGYTNDNVAGSVVLLSSYYSQLRYVERSLLDDRNGFFDGIIRTGSGSELIGGQLQVETPLLNRVRLRWGADYEHQAKNALQLEFFNEQIYDLSNGQVAQKTSEATYVPPYELESLGVFASADWQINDRLQLSGGIRHNWLQLQIDDYIPLYDSDFNRYNGTAIAGGALQFNDLLFNASLVYKLTPTLQLYAQFSQDFFIPDYGFSILSYPPRDFSIDPALTLFQPQKVNYYQIGLQGNWRQVQASLSAFYNESSLGAAYTALPSGGVELVRAPQRNYGIEAAIDWQPSTNWQLGGTLSYSFGENDVNQDGNYLALSSYEIFPIKLSAYIENQTLPNWRNRLQLSQVNNRNAGFQAGSDPLPIDGYTVVNFSSTLNIGQGELTLDIQNLLNEQYQTVNSQLDGFTDETLNLPARGRTVSLTYRIRW